MTQPPLAIRPVRPSDVPAVVAMAHELAAFERATERCHLTEEQLAADGIYLEDLYVHPAARGAGAGQALLAALADVCVERGYRRLEWWVLDWNADARRFYHRLGAEAMDEWTVHRVSGDALVALAGQAYPHVAAKP